MKHFLYQCLIRSGCFIKNTIFLISISFNFSHSKSFLYENMEYCANTVHIISLDPHHYTIELVKALDSAGSGETVSSIAKRSCAEIAINGGFFRIDSDKRVPSRTLVVKGVQYALQDSIQPLVVIDSKGLLITKSNPKAFIKSRASMVSGMPLLINEGSIPEEIMNHDQYLKIRNFRTAIGIKYDGTVVIISTDNYYDRDIYDITLGELQSLMKDRGDRLAQQYYQKKADDLRYYELKNLIKEEFKIKKFKNGLTIAELAKLFKELRCQYAINLDGGGSATLWVENKVINQNIERRNKMNHKRIERFISDAIVFKKRS